MFYHHCYLHYLYYYYYCYYYYANGNYNNNSEEPRPRGFGSRHRPSNNNNNDGITIIITITITISITITIATIIIVIIDSSAVLRAARGARVRGAANPSQKSAPQVSETYIHGNLLQRGIRVRIFLLKVHPGAACRARPRLARDADAARLDEPRRRSCCAADPN